MFKTTIAAAAAAIAFAPAAALAGPYVNVEVPMLGWTGGDYTGATTDVHVESMRMLWVNLLHTTFKLVLPSSL